MSKLALPCIVCDKPLQNVEEGVDNQPYCGTEFASPGHYGSTVHDWIGEGDPRDADFDPIFLVLNVCDTCLLRAIDRGAVQGRSKAIALSRHPVRDESRAHTVTQNYKTYGAAHGDDEPPTQEQAEWYEREWGKPFWGDES